MCDRSCPGVIVADSPYEPGGLRTVGRAFTARIINPRLRVIGLSMRRAPVMYHRLQAGRPLQLPEEEAIPLEDDEYFLYRLIGLQVYSLVENTLAVYSDESEHLGELTQILETGANNVFIVQGARGEILLPDIPDVIVEIDFENGRMLVNLLPGLV